MKYTKATIKKKMAPYLKNYAGLKIDLGCGQEKQEDFFGIDYGNYKGVDLVWDLENVPYPLPDECAIVELASHVVEHITPHKGKFLEVMNEWWRIMKVGGNLLITTPYGGSYGYWQDPTHINPCIENTFAYFDPDGSKISGDYLYQIYKPKPWKIERNVWRSYGNLEVVLQKRSEKEGLEMLKKYEQHDHHQ